MTHVKPKNRQTWNVHVDTSFNIGMAMEHHQCFHIYIVKTRATRISNTVFFKHNYIMSTQVTPKTLVIKGVLELTSALKGLVLHDGKTANALKKSWPAVHKDSNGKSSNGEGITFTEQPPYPFQCPPSCPTSKGGPQNTYLGKPTSKDAGCSQGD